MILPLSDFKKDWSDHALWWPTRNKWLSRPRHTLDQCGVHADAALHFTPMHKPLRIQLPDLRYIDCKIDFSIDTFSAVVHLCKSLGKFKKSSPILVIDKEVLSGPSVLFILIAFNRSVREACNSNQKAAMSYSY